MNSDANPRRRAPLTQEQMARRQDQAVEFTRYVVGDDDLADELEGLSVEEYAERRRIALADATEKEGNTIMQRNPVKQLESENEAFAAQLDEIKDGLEDLLDPSLSREKIVKGLQALMEDQFPEDDGQTEEQE